MKRTQRMIDADERRSEVLRMVVTEDLRRMEIASKLGVPVSRIDADIRTLKARGDLPQRSCNTAGMIALRKEIVCQAYNLGFSHEEIRGVLILTAWNEDIKGHGGRESNVSHSLLDKDIAFLKKKNALHRPISTAQIFAVRIKRYCELFTEGTNSDAHASKIRRGFLQVLSDMTGVAHLELSIEAMLNFQYKALESEVKDQERFARWIVDHVFENVVERVSARQILDDMIARIVNGARYPQSQHELFKWASEEVSKATGSTPKLAWAPDFAKRIETIALEACSHKSYGDAMYQTLVSRYNGVKWDSIATQIGMTRQRVYQLYKMALQKLRQPYYSTRLSVFREEHKQVHARLIDAESEIRRLTAVLSCMKAPVISEDMLSSQIALMNKPWNDCMDFPTPRQSRAFKEHGIKTMGDLMIYATRKSLLNMRRLGAQSVREIADRLIPYGGIECWIHPDVVREYCKRHAPPAKLKPLRKH